jgi:hypothetical protein
MDALLQVMAFFFVAVGVLLALISGIWFLIATFKEGFLWGLACLFIPFASLIFLILHFDKVWAPFAISCLAFLLLFSGNFILNAGAI